MQPVVDLGVAITAPAARQGRAAPIKGIPTVEKVVEGLNPDRNQRGHFRCWNSKSGRLIVLDAFTAAVRISDFRNPCVVGRRRAARQREVGETVGSLDALNDVSVKRG